MEINTTINSISFEKEGYYILSCVIDGRKASVLGNCPYPLDRGEEIKFIGKKMKANKFGEQYKTDLIEIVLPTDKDMIISYLKRAKISGLGGATADKIYATFGRDTFKIIDDNPERLLAVSGIGRKKLMTIIDGWREKRNGPRIIDSIISNYKLAIDKANKIYEKYNDKSLIIIKETPFVIYQDEIINFNEANTIHRLEKNDHLNSLRLASGIIEVLRSACSIEGHCSMPVEETIKKASRLLNVNTNNLKELSETLNFKKMVKTIVINDVKHLQLFSISKIEYNIAAKIHRMLISKSKDFGDLDKKVDYEINDTLKNSGVPISDEQRKAIYESLKNNVNVINGGPGVGKTTIANQIIKIILKNNYTCTLLAPTGRAAKRMTETTGQQAKTIHRLIAETKSEKFHSDFIIVDEFSMVDIFILEKLLSIISDETNLIIIGDADQIMSIGAGCVLRDIIQSNVINISRVNKIRRQGSGSNIIVNAYKVNGGEMVDKGSKEDDFIFIETESDEVTSSFIKRMMESNIQKAFNFNPKTDVQILTAIHGGLVGTIAINKMVQNMFHKNSNEFIEYNGKRFYVGDNIIQNVNDYERMVFNGDVGYIKSINNRSIRVVYPDHNDDEVIYKVENYNQIDLSYAITPFKAQGSEFPVVIIPISHNSVTLLDSSLLFTGITRGSKKVIVIGSRVQLLEAIKRNRSNVRYTTLKDKLMMTFNTLNNQMDELSNIENYLEDINDADADMLEDFILDNFGSV